MGPLANPAQANVQLIGVYNEELVEKIAEVLPSIGIEYGMVVHGEGFDEITLTGETIVAETHKGQMKKYVLTPEDAGFKRINPSQIKVNTKEDNKKIALHILAGEKSPFRDMVLLNAGAAIMLAQKASGKNVTWQEGISMAQKSIDSGAAMRIVECLKQ